MRAACAGWQLRLFALAGSLAYELDTRLGFGFFEYLGHMLFDRGYRDAFFLGDLLVGISLQDHSRDILLGIGQRILMSDIVKQECVIRSLQFEMRLEYPADLDFPFGKIDVLLIAEQIQRTDAEFPVFKIPSEIRIQRDLGVCRSHVIDEVLSLLALVNIESLCTFDYDLLVRHHLVHNVVDVAVVTLVVLELLVAEALTEVMLDSVRCGKVIKVYARFLVRHQPLDIN